MAARAAAIDTASGNRAHSLIRSATAAGSAASRCGPSRQASSWAASASVNRPSATGCAPSAATRPVSRLRLVIRTRLPFPPGSSGRTCSASRALSRTMSIRRPASRLRYRPARACWPAGTAAGARWNASRKPRSASAGVTGSPEGSKPRRLTYSCPSGNWPAAWWAQCSASAVLPTPAEPPIAEITTVRAGLPAWPSAASRAASSPRRPVKNGGGGGSCRGTGPGLRRRPHADAGPPLTTAVPRGSSAGSAARIWRCSSRSSAPGSTPSSARNARRASW